MIRTIKSMVVFSLLLISFCSTAAAEKGRPLHSNAAPAITSTVNIYLKSTDNMVDATVISFPVDIADGEWNAFISDFKKYYFDGVSQRLPVYKINGTLSNGKVQNTRLNLKFADIAFIILETKKNAAYTLACAANPTRKADRYWNLLLNNTGVTKNFLAASDKGLDAMNADFELNYLRGTLPGKKEYIMSTMCGQVATTVWIDWKYVKAMQHFTNTSL